jgi:hypothetical protein
VGLATLAGTRPFIPLAVFILFLCVVSCCIFYGSLIY